MADAAPTTARQLREQIRTLVSAVPNAGNVHLYRRNITNWEQYLNLFRFRDAQGRMPIRGWSITRAGAAGLTGQTGQIQQLFAFGKQARPYLYLIEGICSLEDATASELVWEEVVEAVQDALDAEKNLGGLAMDYGCGPSMLQSWEERQYGSVLCHYVALLYPVEAPRTVNYG